MKKKPAATKTKKLPKEPKATNEVDEETHDEKETSEEGQAEERQDEPEKEAQSAIEPGQDRGLALNPAALLPLYEALVECADSVLHNGALTTRINGALALAKSK